MHEHLNDDEAERLLDGEPGSDPLAATLESIRHHFDAVAPPTPSGALSEFVSVDLVAEFSDSSTPSPTTKDRKKMSISTFVGTAAGKILIGTTVAAASVGGAHASGVVDVPILPDVNEESSASELPDIGEDSTIEVDLSDSDDGGTDSSSIDDDADDAADSADSDSDDSDDADSDDSDDADDMELVFGPRSYDVLDAGIVTMQSDATNGLTIIDAVPADGWDVKIGSDDESDDDGVEVSFRSGDDRVDFKAEVEHGALRVRINDRRTDSEEELWFDEAGNQIAEPDDDESDDHDSDSDDDESDDNSDDDESDDNSDDDNSDDNSDDDNSDDDSDDDNSDDDNSDDDSDDDNSDDDKSDSDDNSGSGSGSGNSGSGNSGSGNSGSGSGSDS